MADAFEKILEIKVYIHNIGVVRRDKKMNKKLSLKEEDLLLHSLMQEINTTDSLEPHVAGYFAQKIKIIRDKLKEKETFANSEGKRINTGEDKSFSLKKPAPHSLASAKKQEYYF